MDLEQRIAQLSPAKLALLEKKLQAGGRNGHVVGGEPVRGGGPQISTAPHNSSAPHSPVPVSFAPLSFAQERLWFLDRMEPGSSIYNLPTVIGLPQAVDPGLIEKALLGVVARHGILRTRFVVKDDSPRQVIDDDARGALDFAVIDARKDGLAPQALNEEMWRPFDLTRGPLLRARLVLQAGGDNHLMLVMHHIVSDGWSINVLLRELRILYAAAAEGTTSDLPAPPQYVDYAIAQRRALSGPKLAGLLDYWRSRMEGAPSLLKLPLDYPRPARQSFRGALRSFQVPLSALRGLKALCKDAGVVPFMVLLAAFNVLLFRYAQQSKIVVGTPVANRGRSEHEGVLGLFANTLVLCSTLRPEMSFRELLAQVRETTLSAYEHQELPFEKLVLELQPERSLSYNPLFQAMFILQNLPTERASASAAPAAEPTGEPIPFEANVSKFDLTLALTETDQGLSGVIEYATDLFAPATIERMATHFINIVSQVLKRPDEPITAFSFLPAEERRRLVSDWNDTARAWPGFLPLHGAFERRARETPDAPAVIFEQTELSYADLDRRANQVASLLRSQGVAPGSIVGVCLPRGVEMVVALFGILKAGGAYMPIDPEFPEARIDYMLAQAGASHVLTTTPSFAAMSTHQVTAINLDTLKDDGRRAKALPPVMVDPGGVAYVIFTSGSTGRPKGVMVSHGAIHNRLQWMQAAYGLTPDDRVMQKTPFTFDVSVWEFFWPLSEGACLVVAEPNRHKESGYLVDLVKARNVTCMHFVPTMLELFLREDLSGCTSLNRIICSGEALTVDQCERLRALPGVRAHNLYGPTEAAVDVTHWDCDQWRGQYLGVPIGRPIANTQIYILNEMMQPAPIGVPGELYIGGVNLALGYLNEPELTRSRFVANPFAKTSGERLYRTGDLARFRDDGVIEYLGRVDTQVKLRGVRIELGEVETVLRACPGVAEAVAVVREVAEHDQRLAAYVVASRADQPPDVAALATELARTLPSYMIPSSITVLPRLPVTANGKLDYAGLPAPVEAKTGGRGGRASDIEREILAIWRNYLKVDQLDVEDDFFAMGGHSILATQAVNAVGAHLHLNVPVRLLFENPTVRRLVQALGALDAEAWRGDPEAMAAISRRSLLRLRHKPDEVGEEDLDTFLEAQLGTAELERFGDIGALLAWARSAVTNTAPRSEPSSPTTSSGAEQGSYQHCCSELVRLRLEMERLAHGDPRAGSDPRERLTALQVEGAHAFGAYVETTRRRFIQEADSMAPAALVSGCMEMMGAARLAAEFQLAWGGLFGRGGRHDLQG
jgi:amino acid adenylation domain-containing protein